MLMPPISYGTGPSYCEMGDECHGMNPTQPLLDEVRYYQDVKVWARSSDGAWHRSCTVKGV